MPNPLIAFFCAPCRDTGIANSDEVAGFSEAVDCALACYKDTGLRYIVRGHDPEPIPCDECPRCLHCGLRVQEHPPAWIEQGAGPQAGATHPSIWDVLGCSERDGPARHLESAQVLRLYDRSRSERLPPGEVWPLVLEVMRYRLMLRGTHPNQTVAQFRELARQQASV